MGGSTFIVMAELLVSLQAPEITSRLYKVVILKEGGGFG
jgi:hypothetical protein